MNYLQNKSIRDTKNNNNLTLITGPSDQDRLSRTTTFDSSHKSRNNRP